MLYSRVTKLSLLLATVLHVQEYTCHLTIIVKRVYIYPQLFLTALHMDIHVLLLYFKFIDVKYA